MYLARGRIYYLLLLTIVMLAVPPAGCTGNGDTAETRTVIVGPPVEPGDANSSEPAISGDGRFVAFTSEATNLLKSSTFGRNVFLKDTDNGVMTLVSVNPEGEEGNGDSGQPSISDDGRLVAFASDASDLADADDNDVCLNASGANVNCGDIFLREIETGTTTLVSADAAGNQGDAASDDPALSGDGRFVAFTSEAANLAAGDDNGATDVFVKDTMSGELKVVSAGEDGVPGNGASRNAAISADGRFVAFASEATDLVGGDGNGTTDVFIKDTETGAVTLVSTDAGGAQGSAASGFEALDISADGRYVIFESGAEDLVAGDGNGKRDVFLKDTATGAITLVSADAAGTPGDDDSYRSVAVSADGLTAYFSSNAGNLVPGDTVNKTDIFRKDVQTGAIVILSVDPTGAVMADGTTEEFAVSANGGYIAFSSAATNLIVDDLNDKADIFRKDLATGELLMISNSTT